MGRLVTRALCWSGSGLCRCEGKWPTLICADLQRLGSRSHEGMQVEKGLQD